MLRTIVNDRFLHQTIIFHFCFKMNFSSIHLNKNIVYLQTLVLSANIVWSFFSSIFMFFIHSNVWFLYFDFTQQTSVSLFWFFSFTSLLLKFPYFSIDFFSHILFFISSYLPPCVLCQIQLTVTPQLGSLWNLFLVFSNLPFLFFFLFSHSLFFSPCTHQ